MTNCGVQCKIMGYIIVPEEGSETAPVHESNCATQKNLWRVLCGNTSGSEKLCDCVGWQTNHKQLLTFTSGAKLCLPGKRIRNTHVNLFYGLVSRFMCAIKLQNLRLSVLFCRAEITDTCVCTVVSPFTCPHGSAALHAEVFVSVSHLERCSRHREADYR